jgi:hypothetical protein
MPKQDRKNLTTFLNSIFEPTDAVALSLLPVKGSNATAAEKVFPYPKFLQQLSAPVLERVFKSTRFACFAPNPQTDGAPRSDINTKTINAVFVDIDNATLPAIAEHAHFVFTRDDTHAHLYFLVERVEATQANKDRARAITKRLIKAANGDTAVHDPARVMRLPYTPHVKNGVESPGYTLKSKLRRARYTFDELETILGEAAPPAQTSANREAYLQNLYTRRGQVVAGDGRSRTLFFIGLDCHGWGIAEPDALRVALDLNDKICDPPETVEVVTHQISSAFRYRKGVFGDKLEAADEKEQKKKLEQFEELVRVRELLNGWVYVAGADRLINTENLFELTTKEQQNTYIAHLCSTRLTRTELVREHALHVLDSLDFRPDIPGRQFERNGSTVFNRYTHFSHEPGRDKKAEKIFTDHLAYLTTTETEYKLLLQFLAFCVQRIGEKVMYAPLIISQFHGQGRGAVFELMQKILGTYCGQIRNSELVDKNTAYMQDKTLLFVHELSQGDKRSTVNGLKDLITEKTVKILEKYARTYETKNTVNFIFFSNHADAIYAEQLDRRFFVVYNDRAPREPKYYETLYKTFAEKYAEIYNFLMTVDLSDFYPYRAPPMTEGKKIILNQSKTELEIYLDEQRVNSSGEFEFKAVSVKKILSDVETFGPATVRGRVGMKAVQNYLLAQGYRPFNVHFLEEGKRVHRVMYFTGTESGLSRAIFEREKKEKSGVNNESKTN